MATAPIIRTPLRPFATSGDVQNRLVDRTLSDEESAHADLLCGLATLSIMASIGLDFDYVTTDEKIESVLGMFTVEMVVRVLGNPDALTSRSETIGSYSYSESFLNRGELGFGLTPAEELMLRRVVFGSNSASVRVRSIASDYADTVWTDLWGLLYGALENGSTIVWK